MNKELDGYTIHWDKSDGRGTACGTVVSYGSLETPDFVHVLMHEENFDICDWCMLLHRSWYKNNEEGVEQL